jgi:hypothetical protein
MLPCLDLPPEDPTVTALSDQPEHTDTLHLHPSVQTPVLCVQSSLPDTDVLITGNISCLRCAAQVKVDTVGD